MHRGRMTAAAAIAVAGTIVGTVGAATGARQEAVVTLDMGTPKELSFRTGAKAVPAGEVLLDVRNRGKVVHELILLKTPVRAKALPTRPGDPSKVEEPGFLVELEDLEPGNRVKLKLPLGKGHYVLLCNIAGHAKGGMVADLTVR